MGSLVFIGSILTLILSTVFPTTWRWTGGTNSCPAQIMFDFYLLKYDFSAKFIRASESASGSTFRDLLKAISFWLVHIVGLQQFLCAGHLMIRTSFHGQLGICCWWISEAGSGVWNVCSNCEEMHHLQIEGGLTQTEAVDWLARHRGQRLSNTHLYGFPHIRVSGWNIRWHFGNWREAVVLKWPANEKRPVSAETNVSRFFANLDSIAKSCCFVFHFRLGLRDEFLLTMLKLRQNHSHAWLAFQFNVSLAYVTRIIKFWIPYLALKFKPLIEWVPRADMAPLPAAFSRFPNTVAIIDCFELKIQSPSNPLDRRRTWSDYKQHMTSKHLIAIAPNGSIMYLSPGYSGRASDTYIVRRSEDFIGNLCEGDEILADKGFGDSIPYVLLIKKALLSVPVYRVREKQFTAEQLELSRGKSRVRIRVEDCIGQLRWFRILRDNIPITLLYLLDDMLVVIAAVTNMHPELGKKKSQQ